MTTRPSSERTRELEPVLDDDPLFGALDDAEQARLEAAVLARVGLAELTAKGPASVRPRAPKRPRVSTGARAAAGALVLAAAAAWLFMPVTPDLPAYALAVPAADASERSDGPARTGRHSRARALTFIFRPHTAVAGEGPGVLAFAREGDRFERLSVTSELASEGALRVHLQAATLRAHAPESLELLFLLGPKSALEGDVDPARPGEGVQSFASTLRLAD